MSELTEGELIVFGDESKLVQGKIGYYNLEDWPVVVADINPHYECVRNPLELAYIFAAAPDMLEALEATNKELESVILKLNSLLKMDACSSDLDEPDYHDMQTCYENQLLIAKAKGVLL